MKKNRIRKNGIVLLNVLMILSILTIFVFCSVLVSRGCVRRVKFVESEILVGKNFLILVKLMFKDCDGFFENPQESFEVFSEERLFNINSFTLSNIGIFMQFLRLLDVDDKRSKIISYSMLDWKDIDDYLSHEIFGAENNYYQQLKPNYKSKGYFFESKEELLLIRGVDQELLNKMMPFITIFPLRSRFKIYFDDAPLIVLKSLARQEAEKMKIAFGAADSLAEKLNQGIDFKFFSSQERLIYSQISKYRIKNSFLKRFVFKAAGENFSSFNALVRKNDLKIQDWNFMKGR